jgi:hypothetical protein
MTRAPEELWAAWLQARDRAMTTGRLEDGIDAGKRWADFLRAFAPPAGDFEQAIREVRS